MNQRKSLSVLFGGLAAAGLGLPLALVLGGCSVEVQPVPVRVYSPPPPAVSYEAPAPEAQYVPAPADVTVQYEHDLGPYGHWVDVQGYGRCWVPNDRPAGWQPYTVGHWVDTDQGWTWVAEGPEVDWGVVTYHYGRWYDDPSNGWVWVPGTTWAPAWVAWRSGGGYSGWCPLPPQCGLGVNISIGLVDHYCPPNRFVYCDDRYIGDADLDHHFERGNVTIINRTTNITNITYVNNRIVNRGVAVADVEARGGHVQRVQVARATSLEDARRLRAAGQPVEYTSPLIEHAAQANAGRYQAQMAHNRAVNRVDEQKTAESQAHERAVNRADAQKTAESQAHDRAVNRTDAQKSAESQAHDRAVQRQDTVKDNTAAAHDRAVQREDTQKTAESQAHDRAVQRTDTTKDEKTAAHDRAVQRNEGKPAEKPAEKPAAKPEEKRTEKPAAKPEDKPAPKPEDEHKKPETP